MTFERQLQIVVQAVLSKIPFASKNADLPWKCSNTISARSGKGHGGLLRTDPSVMARKGSQSYWGKGLVEETRRRAGLCPLQSSFLPLSKTAIMCFWGKNVRIVRADKRARTYISGDSSQLSSSLNNEVPELISSQKLSPYSLVYWVVPVPCHGQLPGRLQRRPAGLPWLLASGATSQPTATTSYWDLEETWAGWLGLTCPLHRGNHTFASSS